MSLGMGMIGCSSSQCLFCQQTGSAAIVSTLNNNHQDVYIALNRKTGHVEAMTFFRSGCKQRMGGREK